MPCPPSQLQGLRRQLFGLPDDFLGGFVTGATMSNFTGLAVARQWAGATLGIDVAREGIAPGQIRVLTAVPHSSAIKSLAMLGMGSSSLERIRTQPDREAMDIAHLRDLLNEQPNVPVIVIASGGTVNTVDYDDLAALADLKTQHRFWLHVDAAFGGFAALSPRYADRLRGWTAADSITIDNHKWLNVPYDSAVWLVRKEHAPLQIQTFQNTNAPYLGDPLADFSYLNAGPENSRRLRALPVWMSLMAYGRSGYQALVEQSADMAQLFGRRIGTSDFARLAAPVRLNVVCFSLNDPQKQTAFLDKLNLDGRVFITPTVYKSVLCLRVAFVNWRTTETDVDIALEAMEIAYLSS
jgi:glutamate/tyrosine decarboxylase-like PLP-dependent enzyme